MATPDNPFVQATDTANLQAGALESLVDNATFFTGAALLSGVASIYNTAADLANAIGGDLEKIDVAKTLADNDARMGAFYERNQAVVDTVGFLGTSLVPGGLALKGLQLAKAGTVLGPFGRALGYMANQRTARLNDAIAEISQAGGSIFNQFSSNKLRSMLWGLGDNALQGLAFETAVVATMHESPLLEKDGFGSLAYEIGKGALAWGAIGGGLEALAIRGAFKGAGKVIDAELPNYNRLRALQSDARGQAIDLEPGSRAYILLESMLDLEKVGQNLEYVHKFLPEGQKITLPTKAAFERTYAQTMQTGWDEFAKLTNEMARGDHVLGSQMKQLVEETVSRMQAAGKSKDEILDFLQGLPILNVKSFKRIEANAVNGIGEIAYIPEKLDIAKYAAANSVDDFLAAVASRSPTGDRANPYQISDKANLKLAIFGTEPAPASSQFARFASTKLAFDAGMDAIVMPGGTLKINPKSTRIVSVDDPILRPRQYFHIPTGSYSFTAYPTIADLATTSSPLSIVGARNEVVAGTQASRTMKAFDEFKTWEIDTIDASSRYAWLSAPSKKDGYYFGVVPSRVAESDIPMLERIYQEGAEKWKEVKLVDTATHGERKVESVGDFAEFLKERKLQLLQQHLGIHKPDGEDLLSLGIKFNADVGWIERAIANNFTNTPAMAQGFSQPLERSLFPVNVEVRWDFSRGIAVSKKLTGEQGAQKVSTVGGKEVKVPEGDASAVMVQMLPDGVGNSLYGKLGTEYSIRVAQDQYNGAVATVLGGDKFSKMPELTEDFWKWLDQQGAGPTTFGASNADYGDPVRAALQYQGQLTNLWIRDRSNAALERIQPIAASILDNKAAAGELGVLTNVLRRSPERFKFTDEDPMLLVNSKAVKVDKQTGETGIDRTILQQLEQAGTKGTLEIENADVAAFLRQHVELNRTRLDHSKVLLAARGMQKNWDPDIVYVPPVDTGRYPFIAFIREKPGVMGNSSEVTMVTAKDEAQLRKLTENIPPDKYQILYKDNVKEFHKAKGDYDYQATIKEPRINADLQRKGVLGDYFPETRAEVVLEDYIRFIQNSEASVVRLAVETKYAQQFAELRSLGKQFEQIGTSKAQGAFDRFRSQIENPYEEYIKMAMDISKRSEWKPLHEMNEFAESLGKTAYRTFAENKSKAEAKVISWQEANRLSEKFGIKGPYNVDTAEQYIAANTPADLNLAREFVSKANMLMVNFTLRLDFVQSLVNAISTPILLSTELASIRKLVADDNVLAGKLRELRTLPLPGDPAVRVPSTLKLIGDAIHSFWSPEKGVLLQRYKDIGAVKEMLSKYHEMIDDVSIKPWQAANKYVEAGQRAVDTGAKWTGNTFSEEFTRFVSADVMRQLTDPIVAAGKMSLAEQNSYISIFVNRVQGNYLASQRPVAFQGVLGSAISLFQTYQFNLLQQLFRHVESNDKKAYLTMLGMQGGLYGANGIPFFEAVNNYLIGQSSLNPAHRDVYSTTAAASTAITGSTAIGNWLLYGTASAFPFWPNGGPALYTRGDINPRHWTVLPVSPTDVVAVDGSIRVVRNLLDIGKKLVAGADISGTLLEGLEHNGINRPLAGMAQVFAGRATTSKGGLISASNDLVSIATLSRVAGAKPMDESLALNTYFRLHGYMAADQQRLENLGEAVKTKLRKGQVPSTEELQDFQLAYAKSGGRIENYSKAMLRWSKDANTSIVNKLLQQHQSQYSKRMIEVMGGTTISDYRNVGSPLNLAATAGTASETEDLQPQEQ